MIKQVVQEAADLYEKWTADIQVRITEEVNSPHPDAMPPGVREAIMLGTIGGCIASHIALMRPETRKWAQKALQESAKMIDAQSLLGGIG